MKKSVIALWVAAALFLVCSFTFLPDGIGEFVSGVVIAAVLALIGYKQAKKPKEAGAPAPAFADPLEDEYEFIRMKVAGVTFKDGRQSRQTMIRRLYWKDDPFDKNEAEVTLQREESEGKPAFAVLLNDRKIGYVPAEHAQYIADNFDRCDGVTHIEAYSGKDDIYGAEIVIRFRKV